MKYSGMQIWFAALITATTSQIVNAAQATLADGAWIVIERCGENPRAQDAELKRGFDRRSRCYRSRCNRCVREEPVRVHGRRMNPDFVVQMRRRHPAR